MTPSAPPRVRSARRQRVCLLAALAGFVAMVAACTNSSSDGAGQLPDDSTFINLDGDTQTLADYRGEPQVVNFFAAWCPPCRAELPEFQKVSQEVAGEVGFLGISTDFTEDAWRQLLDETGVTYPTVFQPSRELFVASEGIGMPTTVFLGSDGETRHTFTGPLTEERLRELIAEHLTAP